MIDNLLRPTGQGPRPPADGFVQALRAGRRKRWRTLRNNVACATAALAAIAGALVPRLSVTSFAGLEPTQRPFGITEAPRPSPASPSPSPTRVPEARDPEAVRPGYVAAGPAGHAPEAAQPAAPGSPAGPPRAEGSPEPANDASAGQQPAPQPPPPPPDPEPSPTEDPPVPPDPEPVDLTYEDQSTTAPCQSSDWCWSAQVVGSYTLRLKACRGATAGTLQFGRENEADFRVVRDGAEVWRWSEGQPDDAYVHPVPVDRWQCAVWSTRWSGVARDGTALPAGTYRLDATSTSTSVPATWWSASFSVT